MKVTLLQLQDFGIFSWRELYDIVLRIESQYPGAETLTLGKLPRPFINTPNVTKTDRSQILVEEKSLDIPIDYIKARYFEEIWPTLPTKEAKAGLRVIISIAPPSIQEKLISVIGRLPTKD